MNIISEYEQILIGERTQFSQRNFVFEPSVNERVSLTVFRYAIEKLLKWSPHDAEKLFTPQIIKKMKLEPLLNYIQFPCELTQDNTEYIIYLLYPKTIKYDFRRYVLDVYKKVISGKMKYPKDYMYGNGGYLRAKICLQYALQETRLFHSTEEMYRFFCSASGVMFLKETKLHQLYTNFYKTPLDYLHNSLPVKNRDDLCYNYYRYLISFKQKYKKFPMPNEEIGKSIQESSAVFRTMLRENKDGNISHNATAESPYDFHKYVINIYEKVLQGETEYPKGFFTDSKKAIRANICLNYILKKKLSFRTLDDLYQFFSRQESEELFDEVKLTPLYKASYNTPIDYIHSCLSPEVKSPFLYHYYKYMYSFHQKFGEYPLAIKFGE